MEHWEASSLDLGSEFTLITPAAGIERLIFKQDRVGLVANKPSHSHAEVQARHDYPLRSRKVVGSDHTAIEIACNVVTHADGLEIRPRTCGLSSYRQPRFLVTKGRPNDT